MKTPPKIPLRFLRWFCRPELLKYIEGDLIELYEEQLSTKKVLVAQFYFTLEVLKLFKPAIIKSRLLQINTLGLIRHHATMTRRVLRKDLMYSTINIFGLALGIASFLAIYQFFIYESSFDGFHQNKDRIYRVTADFSIDGSERRFLAATPPRLAPYVSELLPEIKSYSRYDDYASAGHGDLTLSIGKKKFRESRVGFVNPSFFEIFSFPLLSGNEKTCLSELRTMVLTESTAQKYFGDQDPLGQQISVDGAGELYTITGVIADPPQNSHIQFDVLISYQTLNWWYEGEAENHWTNHEFYSYLLLTQGADPIGVEEKLNELYLKERGVYNASKKFDMHFNLQPVQQIHFDPIYEKELVTAQTVNPTIIKVIFYIGWFILAIAWINYVNLSMARTFRRTAEMGVRKTLGANQSQLAGLFFFETLAVHVSALLLAGGGLLILAPYLQRLIGFQMNWLTISSMLSDWRLMLGVLVASSIIGIYPVLLLNKIRSSHGLGSARIGLGSKSWLYRGLVVFQFSVSVALIIGAIGIHDQLQLMRRSDGGFDKNNKLVIRGPNQVDEDSDSIFQIKHKGFIDEISREAYVRSVTTANKIPGEAAVDPGVVRLKGNENAEGQTIDILSVGLDYFKTLGIKLQSGHTFRRSSDIDGSVILNESAARLFGFQQVDSIIGKTLVLDYKYELPVIGIVDDYNHLSSRYSVEPLIFYCDMEYIHYYVIDYEGHPGPLLDKSERLLAGMFPRDPFEFFFLDDRYNRQYQNDEKLGKTIVLFSGMAILIACLGLIGLASHNTLRRMKEIGIRKTFGAGLSNIMILLNQETAWLLLLANGITWPIMYHLMSRYLDDYATRITLTPGLFVVAGLVVAGIALISIAYVTFKAALANPVDVLRDE
ncbi:ABC transporter permease [Marinoscillum sp.]|uniref:ABC transporter permease n=1 Tax=Marinoscillum sp. TaxID=2024838 RepID=UPI003BAA4DF7